MTLAAPNAQQLASLTVALRRVMKPAWLQEPYASQWSPDNPTLGFCSMAAEAAYFILGGAPAGWAAHVARDHEGMSHWWLEHDDGTRYDPTRDQFIRDRRRPPYERGMPERACGFMGMRQDPTSVYGFGRRPGQRALTLLTTLAEQQSLDLGSPEGVIQARAHLLTPQFTSWHEVQVWANELGVELDVVPNAHLLKGGRPGQPTDALAWIHRREGTPKGRGAQVLEVVRAFAHHQGHDLVLLNLSQPLEAYYQAQGFEIQEHTRVQGDGDVYMCAPAPATTPAPSRSTRRRPR